ncbi:MAG: hypothetical protein OHK006_02820 [Thermodesulfovibrionales bacterium]
MEVRPGRDGAPVVYLAKDYEAYRTVWNDAEFNAAEHGSTLLKNILGDGAEFSFPKSIWTVWHSLRVARLAGGNIALDFFAGSGTTGHAVINLNLEDDSNAEWMLSYLTACLLAFFQQQRLFREHEAAFRPFNLERPLWIFVGGSVTATLATRDASDIVEILRFLSGYVANRADSIERIRRVLHDGLVTAQGKNLFACRFAYLNTCGLTPAQIFDETLATLFNAPAGGSLHVENLKGAAGEVAQALLRKYVERYYTFRKREWELPHLEYRDIAEDDRNFPCVVRESGTEHGYRILIEESQQEIVQKLQELKTSIEEGDFKAWEFQGIKAIWFGRHLYQPLLFLDAGAVEISPAPLNKGERRFVEDLKSFHDANPEYFAERELYLLRNLSKGRGVGFFEAGNFHPDFIVWQLKDNRQQVAFVDPKGIRNVGLQDPKISFFQTVKDIERRLGDPRIVLDSFIVSNTPSHVMRQQWGIEKTEMVKRHIVFQDEDKDSYIGAILQCAVGG